MFHDGAHGRGARALHGHDDEDPFNDCGRKLDYTEKCNLMIIDDYVIDYSHY